MAADPKLLLADCTRQLKTLAADLKAQAAAVPNPVFRWRLTPDAAKRLVQFWRCSRRNRE